MIAHFGTSSRKKIQQHSHYLFPSASLLLCCQFVLEREKACVFFTCYVVFKLQYYVSCGGVFQCHFYFLRSFFSPPISLLKEEESHLEAHYYIKLYFKKHRKLGHYNLTTGTHYRNHLLIFHQYMFLSHRHKCFKSSRHFLKLKKSFSAAFPRHTRIDPHQASCFNLISSEVIYVQSEIKRE